MDCKTLRELQGGLHQSDGGTIETSFSTAAQLLAVPETAPPASEPTLAGELLAGAALAALVVSARCDPADVSTLAARASELTGADPARVGMLALGDPLLLAAPIEELLRASVALIAGLSGADTVVAWRVAQGAPPVPIAHAGRLPAEATRPSVVRFACGDGFDESATLVRAFGRPHAILAWVASGPRAARAGDLAERAAQLLAVAFDRSAEAEKVAKEQAALVSSAERRLSRVGMDLHDGPLQDIALLRGELKALRASLSAGAAGREVDPLVKVDDLMAIAEATEADLRDLASAMEPTGLLERPFDEALRGIARTFAARTGIEPTLCIRGDAAGLTNMERLTLLRVTGEALANAREHSGARELEVSVNVTASRVVAFVRDDGRGFDVRTTLAEGASRRTLGVAGMIERVRLLGGICEVQSSPGNGTSVSVSFDRYAPQGSGARAADSVSLAAATRSGHIAA